MTRGGWQYGAGRPAVRGRVEDTKFIDIGHWKRIGVLEPGEAGHVYPRSRRDPPLAYSTDADAIVLALTANGRRIEQRVSVVRTSCPFGGARAWFCCPCGGRAARLFLRQDGFRCFKCSCLSYPSQRDSRLSRRMVRIGFYPPHDTPRPAW